MSMNTPLGSMKETTPINSFKELTSMELNQYLLGINNILQGDGARITLQNLIKGIISADENNLIALDSEGRLTVSSGAFDLNTGWATAPNLTINWSAGTVIGVGGVFYLNGVMLAALSNFIVSDLPTDIGQHFLYYNSQSGEFEWSVGYPTTQSDYVHHIVEVVIFEDGNKFAINTWGFGGVSKELIEYLNNTIGMTILEGGYIGNVVLNNAYSRKPTISQTKIGTADFSQTFGATQTGETYTLAYVYDDTIVCETNKTEIVPVGSSGMAQYLSDNGLTDLETEKFMNVWLFALPTVSTNPDNMNYLYITGSGQYDTLVSAKSADFDEDKTIKALSEKFYRYCPIARFTIQNLENNFSIVDYDNIGLASGSSSPSSLSTGSSGLPYGTEIALASTIDYVPVGFLPTDGTEYNASDFQELWDDFLAMDVWTVKTVGNHKHYAIIYADNKFVAVGNGGQIATSTDGTSWSTQTVGSNNYQAIAYGNNTFVAVGDSGITATSSDGVTWSTKTVESDFYQAIAYGNNTFVAVGYDGQVASSSDGVNWNSQTVGINDYLAIIYADNKFVAVGNGGQIATSTDGRNWNEQIVESNVYNAIIYGSNKFVAVGERGQISTSTDGTTWSTQKVGGKTYQAIAYGNNTFVAVGNTGNTGQIATLALIYNRNSALLSSLSYTDYNTEISNYSYCSKFGIDPINNKFKVPTKFDKEYRYYIYAKEDDRTVEEWTDYVKSLGGNTTAFSDNQYAPRIIEAVQSGYSGRTTWSNGYCEQWGYDSTASKNATVTLTKEYKDMKFNITDALGGPNAGTTTHSSYANLYRPESTSSFTIYRYDTNAARYCYWKTCGFLASGQY